MTSRTETHARRKPPWFWRPAPAWRSPNICNNAWPRNSSSDDEGRPALSAPAQGRYRGLLAFAQAQRPAHRLLPAAARLLEVRVRLELIPRRGRWQLR